MGPNRLQLLELVLQASQNQPQQEVLGGEKAEQDQGVEVVAHEVGAESDEREPDTAIFRDQHFLVLAQSAEVKETLGLSGLREELVDFDAERVEGEEEVHELGEEGLRELRHSADGQEVVQQRQVPELDDPQDEVAAVEHVQIHEGFLQIRSDLLNIWLDTLQNFLLGIGKNTSLNLLTIHSENNPNRVGA